MAGVTKLVIRCGTPDCDWGFQMWDTGELAFEACYAQFRIHCCEIHGLVEERAAEALMRLDLKKWTLTLLKPTN
jgi:hypothetical protein